MEKRKGGREGENGETYMRMRGIMRARTTLCGIISGGGG